MEPSSKMKSFSFSQSHAEKFERRNSEYKIKSITLVYIHHQVWITKKKCPNVQGTFQIMLFLYMYKFQFDELNFNVLANKNWGHIMYENILIFTIYPPFYNSLSLTTSSIFTISLSHFKEFLTSITSRFISHYTSLLLYHTTIPTLWFTFH